MREIKFRAWNKRKPEMIYFNLYKPIVKDWWSHIKETTMQYTGFLDDKGVEICEGDILENGNGVYLKVYYCREKAMFRQQVCSKKNVEKTGYEWQEKIEGRTDLSFRHNFKKIIGNIYENPELLK